MSLALLFGALASFSFCTQIQRELKIEFNWIVGILLYSWGKVAIRGYKRTEPACYGKWGFPLLTHVNKINRFLSLPLSPSLCVLFLDNWYIIKRFLLLNQQCCFLGWEIVEFQSHFILTSWIAGLINGITTFTIQNTFHVILKFNRHLSFMKFSLVFFAKIIENDLWNNFVDIAASCFLCGLDDMSMLLWVAFFPLFYFWRVTYQFD